MLRRRDADGVIAAVFVEGSFLERNISVGWGPRDRETAPLLRKLHHCQILTSFVADYLSVFSSKQV